MKQLAEQLAILKAKKEQLEREKTNCNKEIATIESQLVDAMEEKDIHSIDYENLGKFFIRTSMRVKVNSMEDVHGFLSTEGYADAFKFTIHHKTLEKIARDMQDKGVMIPGTDCYFQKNITLKK